MKNLDDLEFKEKLIERFPKRYIKDTDYTNSKFVPGSLDGNNLFIWGPVGCGKTQLIIDELALLIQDEKVESAGYDTYYYASKIKFFNATELMAILRSLFNEKSSEDKPYWDIESFLDYITRKTYPAFDYIVIDDLGAEKQSEWVQETFYLLINKLYENEHPNLFITSNCSLEEIAKNLGDRIASRIAEMCEVIKLEGKDRRLE